MSVLAYLQIPVWNNIFELQCSVVIFSFKFHYNISIFFHHLRSALQYEYNKHLIDTFCTNFFKVTLRENCPNTEFFLVRIFLHSNQIQEIRTRKNSVFGRFSRVLPFYIIFFFVIKYPVSRVSFNYRGLFIKACSICLWNLR